MYSTLSVEVLGKVVGALTVRLVAMEDKGIKGNILLIEINRRMWDTVCRERLTRMVVILHGGMMVFFQLEEEAPLAKKRPPFQEMKVQDSAAIVTDLDSGSRKPDQPGPTSAMREERRNYHPRGFGNHRPFVRPDDRGFRRGFPDHRSEGQRNGYDSRGRFPGRGGIDRDRFSNPYGGSGNVYHQTSSDQEEKWKHDLYDQSNRSPPPKTEEEQIAKVEALLAL